MPAEIRAAAEDVKTVAVVGTGTIGAGWAAVYCAGGLSVRAYVRSEASERKFERFLQRAWAVIVQRGLSQDPAGWKSVKCFRDLAEAVASSEYVQESVVENALVKQGIIRDIDAAAPPGVIIGTSSSYMPASLCALACEKHPERVATAHPTQAHLDSIVEVFGTTAEDTAWLVDFFRRFKFDVIALRKESHGHVVNALNAALGGMAAMLEMRGVANVADIDLAVNHLGKIFLACPGGSGILTGFVGGGSEEATDRLLADVAAGAPLAIPAASISNMLGSGRLGRFFLKLWQLLIHIFATSIFAQWAARKLAGWATTTSHIRWQEVKDGWDERFVRRMCDLEAAHGFG